VCRCADPCHDLPLWPRRSSLAFRHHRGDASQVRRRLAAGGDGFRTLGSPDEGNYAARLSPDRISQFAPLTPRWRGQLLQLVSEGKIRCRFRYGYGWLSGIFVRKRCFPRELAESLYPLPVVPRPPAIIAVITLHFQATASNPTGNLQSIKGPAHHTSPRSGRNLILLSYLRPQMASPAIYRYIKRSCPLLQSCGSVQYCPFNCDSFGCASSSSCSRISGAESWCFGDIGIIIRRPG